MAYSAVWSESIPAGSLAASDLDQAIRDAKRDLRERMASVFGMADWSADPLVSQYIAFQVNPATVGLIRAPNNVSVEVARNAANSADIIISKLTAANIVEFAGAKLTVDPTTGDTVIAGAAGTGGSALTVKSGNPTGTAINFSVPDNWSWDFRRKASLGGSAFFIADDGSLQVPNGKLLLQGLSPTIAPLHITDYPSGVAPTTLVDGVMWCIGNDLWRRIGGVSKKVTFA